MEKLRSIFPIGWLRSGTPLANMRPVRNQAFAILAASLPDRCCGSGRSFWFKGMLRFQAPAFRMAQDTVNHGGEDLAGIVHKIRNPLGFIQGAVNTLAQDLPPKDSKAESAQIARKEVSRLERLTNEILQFSKPARPNSCGSTGGRLSNLPVGSALTRRGLEGEGLQSRDMLKRVNLSCQSRSTARASHPINWTIYSILSLQPGVKAPASACLFPISW
jgi:signal transduction histidine kinase